MPDTPNASRVEGDVVTVRRQMWATLGARNAFTSALRRACWQRGIQLDLAEDSGWFETAYYATLTGHRNAVSEVNALITRWANDNS